MDIQVMRARSDYELDLAYQCHHDWFAEAGYISPTNDGRYIDTFTARSTYFLAFTGAALTQKSQVIGVVRAVNQGPFRTLSEFEICETYRHYDFSDQTCLESSGLCWRGNWGLFALPHLYRALFQHGLLRGKQNMICNLDERVVRITKRMGFPVTIFGKTKHYMGSLKTPILIEGDSLLAYLDENRHNPVVQILQTPIL